MLIAFPTLEDKGQDSQVYGHFGSAQAFVIVDSDTGAVETASNSDRVHEHGRCQPLAALGGYAVKAVVVGGIGAGALRKLNAGGVGVYRAVEGTVRDNLTLLKSGALPMFTLDQTCAGHGHGAGGPCAH